MEMLGAPAEAAEAGLDGAVQAPMLNMPFELP